ncbi:PREDICTED: mucin-1-like isoform X1 [Vollenhovia emeryi]|uniref:mucin-1-like isoform X1 n=1 Tax=Vollenhovia emeryi TaxID=411798 RepID=UPI0005F36314|nr:PREDICTED: mucin-1-like isoform X1 [Vollenhovia emeryi]
MDIRIFALVALIAVLGSFTEARSPFGYPYGNGGLRVDRPSASFAAMSRLKRAVDDSNGESTTTQATTTSSTTDPTTTPSSTTPSSTTPPTTPSTEPTTTPTTTTTTEATSPTTTPTSTSATTPTTTSTTPSTTPSTTTSESTTPTSEPKNPNDIQSRLNTDAPEPEDSNKKPGPSKDGAPTPGPYFGAPGFGFGGYGPGFDPYFGYPGFNSIPGYSPNYAWTGTNNGPGYASAGSSAGSFGYPGMGYPMAFPTPFPTAGSPTAFPTGSPSFGSRGGFPDNSPNQDNSLNKDNSPNQNGYNFGGDPLYNSGSGLFYPGQFPNYNDPTFDMIKQIQAQIEAQQQATMDFHNRLANEAANYGNYGGGTPQISSASIGLGPYGGFQSGQISPAAPGIESRFAEDLPAPSGNSYGVFASSSSSSMTGPDGRPINRKSSITGVNDNGRISFRTVHD